MGIITEIRAKNRTLFQIFLDDECISTIDGGTIESIGAKVGDCWEIDEWKEAVRAAQAQRCMDTAVAYLHARERSAKEIERKLAQKGYCSEAVDSVIEKLVDYKYIDDERYARRLAEQKLSGSKPLGKMAVAQKLKQRGIGDELAHTVLLETDEQTERENALIFAKKLWPKYPEKTRDKVAQRLAAKGFGYDTIRYVLRAMEQD